MSPLKRPKQPMTALDKTALTDASLMAAYRQRPPCQRNDYLSWINRAKREDTKQKRLEQMLSELAAGDKYMKMDYRAK